MPITKAGIFAIAGRPNVGKSTLANAIAGEKVAIVTHKPQTTRTRITAIAVRGDCQYIFIDTPGFHKAATKLGEHMNRIVGESVNDVDAVLLMVEPVAAVGKPEQLLIEKIQQAGVAAVLVINKVDTVPKERLLEVITAYQAAHEFEDYLMLSARKGDGLDSMFEVLERFAIAGPQLYPDGEVSDQPERQMLAEIVREKMLLALDREVPHGVAVAVEEFEEQKGAAHVGVTIYCEKESHKGIIVGKQGSMLKEIGRRAREEMELRLGRKVYLETWVKVKKNWRQSEAQLRNFGFHAD